MGAVTVMLAPPAAPPHPGPPLLRQPRGPTSVVNPYSIWSMPPGQAPQQTT
jgi:hypothetical protein